MSSANGDLSMSFQQQSQNHSAESTQIHQQQQHQPEPSTERPKSCFANKYTLSGDTYIQKEKCHRCKQLSLFGCEHETPVRDEYRMRIASARSQAGARRPIVLINESNQQGAGNQVNKRLPVQFESSRSSESTDPGSIKYETATAAGKNGKNKCCCVIL